MNHVITRTIDELNERMEQALDKGDTETHDTLDEFYQWFVEQFVL